MYPFSQFSWKRQTGGSVINITGLNIEQNKGYWLLLDIDGSPGPYVSILLVNCSYTRLFMKPTSDMLQEIWNRAVRYIKSSKQNLKTLRKTSISDENTRCS